MWLDLLFQGCIDAAQSEQVSRPVRTFCIVLISLVFLIAISSLFLLVFVIEGQGLFRRGIFLVMGTIAFFICGTNLMADILSDEYPTVTFIKRDTKL